MQLLEPEKYPHLYKCLYGLLMLLPQSSAFAALKNRLNSVSSIGYLHIAPRTYVPTLDKPTPHSRQDPPVEASLFLRNPNRSRLGTDTHNAAYSSATTPGTSNFDRPNRLKGREEGIIRWNELLEKFRSVQERARRAQRHSGDVDDGPQLGVGELRIGDGLDMKAGKDSRNSGAPPVPVKDSTPPAAAAVKKSGLGRQLGRFGGAVSGRGKRADK
jgi:vacuole morphology and inheritance protein 14